MKNEKRGRKMKRQGKERRGRKDVREEILTTCGIKVSSMLMVKVSPRMIPSSAEHSRMRSRGTP